MRISDWSSDVGSSDLHTVVIDGNRIRDVQPGNVTIDGAKAIDLGTQTCLPGLIDSHVHLTGQFSPTSYSDQFRDRKSVVSGKSVSVRVALGGRRFITQKTPPNYSH